MNICQAMRLTSDQPNGAVAIVGAGGKTTALFQLARCIRSRSDHLTPGSSPKAVIVSATTHLRVDQIQLANSHWLGETPADFAGLEENLNGVILLTGPQDGDRTRGLAPDCMDWLFNFCNRFELPLLIEADGSRQHPLKAPDEHEPPIPDFVTTVLVVAGLSALGKPFLHDFVHRPEIYARISGLRIGEQISRESILRVLTHPEGGLKNIPARARRMVLLNQADTPELLSSAGKMAYSLLEAYDGVIVGSLEQTRLQTFEHTAGIILAAGEARRFGQPKQLLDYHGEPFVRIVAKTALAGGLAPVWVVSGANAAAVEAALQDLPIRIIHNPDWMKGQSTSIKTGLKSLSVQHPGVIGTEREVGAAIFLLADQPQVPASLVQALTEQHSLELAPIIAPLVNDRRANPVLFDRCTFPDLMALSGDVGGRAIFSKYSPTYLPWHDDSLLLDVDTPEDFTRLKELEG